MLEPTSSRSHRPLPATPRFTRLALPALILGAAPLIALAAPPPASKAAHTAIDPPAAAGALAPRWTLTHRGPLLTWLEPWAQTPAKTKGHRLRAARFESGRWSKPVTVAQGTSFFANWADTPGAVEAADGTLYAHWLEKSGGESYDYGIQLARSTDGGATWTKLGLLNRDGEGSEGGKAHGEHGFVSWLAENQGDGVRAFWVDGREIGKGAMGDPTKEMTGAMTLRTARVSGVAKGAVRDDERLDARICDCCQTGAALAEGGPVVVYRDRTEKEIRDIQLLRRTTTGWSEPVRLGSDNWEIQGCPVNGPVVAARGKKVVVAWFSAGGTSVRVQVAASEDGGATFGSPMVLDDASPIGRVDLVLDADGSAIASWYAFAGEGAELRLRRIRWEGKEARPGPTVPLATTTPARSSGFPKLLVSGDRLLVAWVDDATPQHLRAASLPLASVP